MPAPTLRAMAAFRRVVETRSFKGAAASLGLSGGAVSKLVAQLEADLGAQLLTRSTRALSLTEAGRRFYASAVPILDDVDCATAIARIGISLPSGGLKVAVPTSFALRRLAPGLPDFLVAHPAVQLQLSLDDRYVDLVEGGFDCALRIAAHMPDSTLVARRLGQAGLVLAAAPRYLRNAPAIARPEDLVRHNCLLHVQADVQAHALASPGAAPLWTFRGEGSTPLPIEVAGSLRVNHSVMLRDALLSGCGVALTPRFVVEDLLADGRLLSLLEPYLPAPLVVYGVTAQQRYLPHKVKAFLDFAERVCGD